MRKNYNFLGFIAGILGVFSLNSASAQCPAVTCPPSIQGSAAQGTCGAVINWTPPVGTNVCGPPAVVNFAYTGAVQTFTVPAGVTSVTVDAKGASGGASYNGGTPGYGGRVQTTLTVTPGQVLSIYVGGVGAVGSSNPPSLGGFNGGGNGTGYAGCCGGGGGGGATDIRAGGVALVNRVVVASGGGAAGSDGGPTNGGSGGGLIGGDAAQGNNPATVEATGGTQLAGGTGGSLAGYPPNGNPGTLGVGGGGGGGLGGGGGGGYYGGGGGVWAGGGGGSSFTDPNLCANTTHTANYQNGAGAVTISYALPITTTLIAGLPPGSTFPVGTTVETYQVTDYLGNTAQCSFNVVIVDNENPTISCQADTTVNNDPGVCGAVVNFATPVGSDNCSAIVTQTAGLASGSLFPIGITNQVFVVTDPAGHTATCSFKVTVVDNELPTISCGGNVTSCQNVVNNIAPTGSSDNCSNYVTYNITGATTGFGNNDASGTMFNIGTSTVTYKATDPAGNFSTCSFNVVINPNYNVPQTIAICQGQSVFVGGAFQNTPGTYIDSLQTAQGCDSVITTQLVIDPAPAVTLSPFAVDSVCLDAGLQTVPMGTPFGGTYSGNGVVNFYNFNPGLAGVGTHWIYYTSYSPSGCGGVDSTTITVLPCTGIYEKTATEQVEVYPNPSNGMLTITLGSEHKAIEVTVMEINGRVVMKENYNSTGSLKMDISALSTGMYFLQVKADNNLSTVKVMKN